MRLMKRVTAIGLVAAMTITGSGFTAFAGTYSNADSICKGTTTQKLFNSQEGSLSITGLKVPTLAYDDTSVGLVWEKPQQYANVADYNVYINGVKQADTARQNFTVNADWTATYMDAFYKYYEGDGTNPGVSDVDMVNVDIHSYRATGLKPDTSYTFKVVAIDKFGNELGTAQEVTQKTTVTPDVFNIADYGATTSIGYTSYNDEINAAIVKNTKAIQAAIDACTPGGKVVVPEGIYVSGAVWLKSNMTLEINGTLWASPNSDHFEIGFLMYPFYTDTRSWGIINACSTDENQQVENVRITGNGTVFGNGWKYGVGTAIDSEGGLITNINKAENKLQAGDVDTTKEEFKKYSLPQYVSGGSSKIFGQGILSADSSIKYLTNLTNADGSKKYDSSMVASLPSKTATDVSKLISSDDLTDAYATRSSLIIFRNVNGVYIDDLTVTNPSNHTINILDSNNIAVNNVKELTYNSNNGDGMGFGCSQNIVCWNNFYDTGDDSINFAAAVGKAAQDCEAQSNSSIWVFDNFLREGHGGAIAAGSHTSNGITDILCEDNVMNHSDMPFRFKSAPTTGGYISNITMRDCAVADCEQAFVLTTSYSDGGAASTTEAADVPSTFYNFAAYNITAYSVKYNTICVYADVNPQSNTEKPWHTHHNLYFQDITFGDVGVYGKFKSYGGWETLTGCEDSTFYNVNTVSYDKAAKDKGTDVAWSNIKYCKNIQFLGTTKDTLNACTDNMNAASMKPIWGTSKVTSVSGTDGTSVDLSWDATTLSETVAGSSVTYGVDTYVGDNKVDTIDGIKGTTQKISGLSAGTNYTFRVYATANSSTTKNSASCNATVNKTEGPSATVTTTGSLDKTPVTAPVSSDVTLDNAVYTCAQATWESALKNDPRVRGYKIYINGKLNETIYNWQLSSKVRAEKISHQIGRLAPGTESTVKIVAFTDSGVEYEYNTAKITTLPNYDFKAPVFAPNASISTTKKDNGDVVLTWDAAKDDTAVSGYRVYVDGNPIYTTAGDYFNPVNGKYTTTETTYIVSGLDLTKDHTFTVKAGDTWYKAATKMGTFDKMAGFNWTVNGLTKTLVAPSASTPLEVVANENETVTSDAILNVAKDLVENEGLIIDAKKGSVGVISNDVFKEAAQKKSTVVIKTKNCTWEFSNIPTDTTASFSSPEVTIGADVKAITDKITSVVDPSKVLQLSFANSGVLPGEAKVTLNLNNAYTADTVLYFYYYNPETGLFEDMQKCDVDENGNVTVTLTHCSDYVLTSQVLPESLTTPVVVNNQSVSQVSTGDQAPIAVLFLLCIASLGIVYFLKRKRNIISFK